jgi:hypothetical protein
MTYADVKAKRLAGETLTIEMIDAAIAHQVMGVAFMANSLAKHAAKLGVVNKHPFPLPEDQKGRVGRRIEAYNSEMSRLVRLHGWRELVSLGVTA